MIYAPTVLARTTLTQEVRVIVPACVGPQHKQAGRSRHVQILIPDAPVVLAGLDVRPAAVGPNRSYKLAICTPGEALTFELQPHQYLVAASEVGLAQVSIIVEYREAK